MFKRGKNSLEGVVTVLPDEVRTWWLARAKPLSVIIAIQHGELLPLLSAEQSAWPGNKLHALRL